MGLSLLLSPENREVGHKLGLATLCMCVLPVATFYGVYAWKKDDLWAGGAAIVMTNLIVGTYCYLAYVEDQEDTTQKQKQDNDASAPRVGIYKQRVD